MNSFRSTGAWVLAVAILAVAILAVVALALTHRGAAPSQASPGESATSVPVSLHADAGPGKQRILRLGGLVVRASCTDYGQGRQYLGVAAKTTINDAARALVLSQRHGGQAQTYSFKSSDFDRNYGWYDITGTNPYDTTGTFSYARPDGGQIALTFRADQDTGTDCVFDGEANYLP